MMTTARMPASGRGTEPAAAVKRGSLNKRLRFLDRRY